MNKTNILIITSIILVVSAGISVGLLALIIPEKTMERVEFNSFESFDAQNIYLIDAEIISGSMSVTIGITDKISLDQEGYCDVVSYGDEQEIISSPIVTNKDGIIRSKLPNNNFDFRSYVTNCQQTTTILVPESYAKNLAIETVNADVLIDTSKLETIDVETVSGEVNINSESMLVSIESVSGDVNIHKTNNLDFESVSGNLIVYFIEQGDIDTVSGNVELQLRSEQTVSYESISGEVQGSSQTTTRAPIKVETVSGNLIIS